MQTRFILGFVAVGIMGCASSPLPGLPSNESLPLFAPARPTQTFTASPAQRKALENFAADINLDAPDSVPVGFGLGATQFAEPIRSTLLRVEMMAGYRFDWQFSPMIPDSAMSFPGGIIAINPQRMNATPDAVFFVLMHEAGHHVLGHTSQAGVVATMQQPWLLPNMELGADRWAVVQLAQAGVHPDRILLAALEIFGNNPGDATHPPGTVRMANVRSALATALAGP